MHVQMHNRVDQPGITVALAAQRFAHGFARGINQG
jgi:hypothetical protein